MTKGEGWVVTYCVKGSGHVHKHVGVRSDTDNRTHTVEANIESFQVWDTSRIKTVYK